MGLNSPGEILPAGFPEQSGSFQKSISAVAAQSLEVQSQSINK
jgi:hypothetical protein